MSLCIPSPRITSCGKTPVWDKILRICCLGLYGAREDPIACFWEAD